ncbi:MAG: membrane protein insertase YidC [Clostridiaceae bacterium]|nr:membrane protein insertase YidC [Clostridiaceae bacterium]
MQGLLSAIALVFGKLMYFIYNTIGFHNYALSLVFFTLVYKLILLPLSIKQTKSSQRMQELQPELQRIQARYKNDKEKLQEETMKFYQENNYNPTSGCLPLLIQLPILIALFYVIRMPMTYMFSVPAKAIGEMTIVSVDNGYLSYGNIGKETYDEIKDNPIDVYSKFTQRDYYFEIKLIDVINNHPEILEENQSLTDSTKKTLSNFNIKMFKIFNLGVQPTYNLKTISQDPALYIPPLILLLIAVITTFVTSKLMMPPMPESQGKDKQNANAGCTGKGMMWMSPLMTLWIGSSTPSGLSLYWIINNILTFIQHKAMKSFTKKDDNTSKEDEKVVKVGSERSKKR